jgi:hypothetical protein
MLQDYCYITSVLDGGEWSASRPGHFTREERALVAHWIEGWVGSRAGLNGVEKNRKIYLPGIEPPSSIRLSSYFTG